MREEKRTGVNKVTERNKREGKEEKGGDRWKGRREKRREGR